MAFEEGKTRFTCPTCKAELEAKWSRLPVRERTTVQCIVCGATVLDEKSTHDYDEVHLARPT